MSCSRRHQSQAFSLIELLATLAITGILVAVGVPNLSKLISYNRATASINRIIGIVHLARSEAAKRGITVSLCPKVNDTCGTDSDWHKGILIFADVNSNGNMDEEDSPITVLDSFAPERLSWRAWPTSKYLRFTSRGFMLNQNGSFTYCPADNNSRYARQIIINKTGRPRLARDSDHNGIVEDSQGQDVTCN